MAEKPEEKKNETKIEETTQPQIPIHFYVMLGLLVVVLAFNQFQIMGLSSQIAALGSVAASTGGSASGGSSSSGSSSSGTGSSAELSAEQVWEKIKPSGVPPVYGKELGVNYDDTVGALGKLAALDDSITYSSLNEKAKTRYLKIGFAIACEYCCGAKSLIFSNGEKACGCQHSYAMRGIAKYILKNYPEEFTDDQIVEELAKWKMTYFPKQHISKAMEFMKAGMPLNAMDLASQKYRGFKASTASSSGSGAATGSGASSLPNMVGGC
ncbi:MAG: hypothetical protein AABW86_02150 [Candidatus Micrarchaeota archaeon]